MALRLLLMTLLVLILVVSAIYDGGYHRFNRITRSHTLQKVDTFSLSTINSQFFTRDLSSTPLHSQSIPTTPSWSELALSLDQFQTETLQFQTQTISSQSTTDHNPLEIPFNPAVLNFNQKITSESWGSFDWFNSNDLITPYGKIRNNIGERLDWDHLNTTSTFAITVNTDQLLIQLSPSTHIGSSYNPKVQHYDPITGQLLHQTSPPSHTHNCFYNAKIIGVQKGSKWHEQSSNTINIRTFSNNHIPTTPLSQQSTTNDVTFSTTTLSSSILFDEQSSSSTNQSTTLTTNFPEYGLSFPINTCRGGFTGSFHYNNKLYEVAPILNHLSIAEIAMIMAQIAENDNIILPDINSVHIVFDATQPSYDFVANYINSLQEHGLEPLSADELITSFCASGSHTPLRPSNNTTKINSEPVPTQHSHSHDDGDDEHHHSYLFDFLQATTSIALRKYHEHNNNHNHHQYTQTESSSSNPYVLSPYSTQYKSSLPKQQQQQSSTTSNLMGTQQTTITKYVEWLLVSDQTRVASLGIDQALYHGAILAQRVESYSNYHNSQQDLSRSYSFPLHIVLVDQLAWMRDPYDITPHIGNCASCSATEVDVDELLRLFNQWGARISPDVPLNDNRHLLSGLDFQGSVLGYAGVGTMCSLPSSSGIDQIQTSDNTDFFAIVIFHEIIHNFGSSHDADNNSCPANINVMSPSLSLSQSTGTHTQLSTCSLQQINPRLSLYSCLNNQPSYVYGEPRCGNNIIEGDEECDCGTNCNDDPCCNGTTCKLHTSVIINGEQIIPQCSLLQHCCDTTCQIRPSNYECAPATNDCDLPETCDGISPQCPRNIFKGPSWECSSKTLPPSQGLCFQGSCITEQTACSSLSASVSSCGYNDYVIPPTNDDWCANKQCLISNTCSILAQTGDQTKPIPWDDGISCGGIGSGKQCYQGKCVDINTIPGFLSSRWEYSEFETCGQCGSPQTRSATCRDKTTGDYPSNVEQCPEPTATRAGLIRPCNAVQLGCVYDYSDAEKEKNKGKIYFFGFWLSSVIVACIFVGVILTWVILALCCYRCVTRPVDGRKNMSDNNDDDFVEPDGKKDDKKDQKKKKTERKDSGGILLIVGEQPNNQPQPEQTHTPPPDQPQPQSDNEPPPAYGQGNYPI